MRSVYLILALLLPLATLFSQEKPIPTISAKTDGMDKFEGFFPFYWSEKEGKIYLEIDQWDVEFLYVNSLAAGLGSNDIGLDRNQLGDNRLVRFRRVGPKVLLQERNLGYRAISDNIDERQSVADAFAQSILAGFKVEAATEDRVLVDLTSMLMTDAHGVAKRLKDSKQGSFKIDPKRSAVYLEKTKNFPQNSEFEAQLTFVGEATGRQLRSVAATPDAFTLRMHHSFVQLPDSGYEPRLFDPNSGYFPLSYADYATPIDQPLVKRFIRRHRLEKKDPTAEVSEAVEPIVYYLDRGAPEPIRSALIEGASWWDQAFAAAGYKDAFRVELLPEGADPLDVRYNVINWVHRSTRGWSYGSSVIDPRTGEIIKGHVLLGSLRVRQDFLIAQGLFAAYENGESPDPRLEAVALARLRQLSAHEVGHTLGLAHNFAASVDDRASVMDYPHPYFSMGLNRKPDFTAAYAVGIGEWDKRTILYGYQDFPEGADVDQELNKILGENAKLGFHYISDPDARPVGGAHPQAHLWDNGNDPTAELKRISEVRAHAVFNFGPENIPVGAPMGTLEEVFVPVYLMHRYQVEAVAKLIGGYQYDYAMRGAAQPRIQRVHPLATEVQQEALDMLVFTLSPNFLGIPNRVLDQIPPRPYGYQRGRELFNFYSGPVFDPIAAAEASAEHTLTYLLHPERLARITNQYITNGIGWESLTEFLGYVEAKIVTLPDPPKGSQIIGEPRVKKITEIVHHRFYQHLLQLAANRKISPDVQAAAMAQLSNFRNLEISSTYQALLNGLYNQFTQNPDSFQPAPAPKLPDGSPIGCGE